MNYRQVEEVVKRNLKDALNLQDLEVQDEALLAQHLGAEDLDYLDIVFRLKRDLGIEFNPREVFPRYDDHDYKFKGVKEEDREPDVTVAHIIACMRLELANRGQLDGTPAAG